MQNIAVSRIESLTFSNDIEYIIYGYDSFEDKKLGTNHWQRITSGYDCDKICFQAEKLFNSAQYQKIEIKQKSFDDRKGKHIASIYRTYEKKPEKNILALITIFLMVFSFVGLFYLQNG